MRLLIVEDQKHPLRALENAVGEVMPRHFPNFTRGDYDIARCYNRANDYIRANNYDIVILDSALPYEDQGDLEDTDFDRWCETIKDRGYRLIPKIKEKNKNAIVIGTSSSSREILRDFPKPEFTMRKIYGEADEDLEVILKAAKI